MRISDLSLDFDELLEDAIDNARTTAEVEFVQDMNDKYGLYGQKMFVSDAQLRWLERIAGW